MYTTAAEYATAIVYIVTRLCYSYLSAKLDLRSGREVFFQDQRRQRRRRSSLPSVLLVPYDFILVHPDPTASLSLTADASDIAVGAVLGQGASQAPLAFFSKKLSAAERKYSAFDKELLALYLSVKHFRPALEILHRTP